MQRSSVPLLAGRCPSWRCRSSLHPNEHSIPALDALDPSSERDFTSVGAYRRHYFLRRSLATIRDFAECFRLINQSQDFEPIRRLFTIEHLQRWKDANVFFRANEITIRKIRGDLGGHFGSDAAEYALDTIDPKTIFRIEIRATGNPGGTEVFLHPAGDLVGQAFYRTLKNQNISGFETLLDDLVKPSFLHARWCMRILTRSWVLPACE
jgi:hypothetical protein